MSTFNGWTIISLPTTPPPRSLEWGLMDVVGVNASPFSLQKQFQDWGQSRLSASVSYQPMTAAQAAQWEVFLMACRGPLSVFQIGDPIRLAPQNSGASAGAVSGSGQTGYTLVTTSSGLTAGDWFALGVRLYRVTSVSGGTLGIWPPLRESPTSGTALTIVNTQGLFRLVKNDRKYSVNEMRIYGFTFECEEAL